MLNVERIYLNEYDTIQELKDDVRDYMEFYNYKRFHETLEYKKPMSVYREGLEVNSKNYKALQQIVVKELNFRGSCLDIWGGI